MTADRERACRVRRGRPVHRVSVTRTRERRTRTRTRTSDACGRTLVGRAVGVKGRQSAVARSVARRPPGGDVGTRLAEGLGRAPPGCLAYHPAARAPHTRRALAVARAPTQACGDTADTDTAGTRPAHIGARARLPSRAAGAAAARAGRERRASRADAGRTRKRLIGTRGRILELMVLSTHEVCDS